MEKLVKIEGKEVGFKASAGTVRAYRDAFGRDLLLDMNQFETELLQTKSLSVETAPIAENALWIMAKEYDPDIPELEEWLDQFSPYFVYGACVHCINMWTENVKQINSSKKK